MNNILTKKCFEDLKTFNNPNGRKNLKYIDENYMLKICLSDTKYWNKVLNKNLPGFNIPVLCIEIEKEIETIVNSVFLSENYNSAAICKILKNYNTLNSMNLVNYNSNDILKLIRNILNYNAIAVSNGFIHTDYLPSNIMINKDLDAKIIDMDESIIEGYNMQRPLKSHNGVYLYNMNELDSIKKVIACDKATLLNLFLNLLLRKNVSKCDAVINPIDTYNTIKYLKLPEELEYKYIDILINKVPINSEDFFVDDFDYLIKYDYNLK